MSHSPSGVRLLSGTRHETGPGSGCSLARKVSWSTERKGVRRDNLFNALKAIYTDTQIVELTFLIGCHPVSRSLASLARKRESLFRSTVGLVYRIKNAPDEFPCLLAAHLYTTLGVVSMILAEAEIIH